MHKAPDCCASIPYGHLSQAAPLLIQLPASACGEVADGPNAWDPALMRETQMEFEVPDFGLAQLWPQQPFKE